MTDAPSPYLDHLSAAHDAPPLVLLCEHGGAEIPDEERDLGLGAADRFDHIAWDIGAAELTRALAGRLGAPALINRASRLLFDANRPPDDPTAIRAISDGRIVPGNRDLDAAAAAARKAAYFDPFHNAAAALVRDRPGAAVLAVHSFTPIFTGRRRVVEIGLLWDDDDRIAMLLAAPLRAAGFVVAQNEPYSGRDGWGWTIPHHAADGRPSLLIEVRNDLIDHESGVDRVAAVVVDGLRPILAHLGAACGNGHFIENTWGGETMIELDPATREQLEAAAFRRLVAHLRARTDVQNIDLMTLAGFCRNCLSKWYASAAQDAGVDDLDYDAAREIVYGMPYAAWKAAHQTEATAEQATAFAKSHAG